MLQKEIFLKGEGDRWFDRNLKNKEAEDIPSELFIVYKKYLKAEMKVLEIGCSTGENLNYFSREIGCQVYGIDPSADAIEKGKRIYPKVNLSIGTSDKLDYPNEYFDFVFFGWCLYLVDRELLVKTVSEADRVLKDGGYLGITDFNTEIPKKRKYKHLDGVFSYKYDYSKMFLGFPQYFVVEKKLFNYKEKEKTTSTIVMNKSNREAYYQEDDF